MWYDQPEVSHYFVPWEILNPVHCDINQNINTEMIWIQPHFTNWDFTVFGSKNKISGGACFNFRDPDSNVPISADSTFLQVQDLISLLSLHRKHWKHWQLWYLCWVCIENSSTLLLWTLCCIATHCIVMWGFCILHFTFCTLLYPAFYILHFIVPHILHFVLYCTPHFIFYIL